MTTWVKEELRIWEPATPEEIAHAQAIMAEKSRPENIVVLPLSAVPQDYRHFLSKQEGGYHA